MKKSQTTWAGIVFILGLILILHAQETALQFQPAQVDSIVQLTAESQGLELVSPAALPRSGTYWLVQAGSGSMAPLPGPPQNANLPVYQIADGQFLVDATGGQVSLSSKVAGSTVASALEKQADAVVNLISRIQEAQFNREFAMVFGFEEELDFSPSFSAMLMVADPDALWLEITNVAGGLVDLNLHNGTNQVYALWVTTNLLTTWQVERELWPTNSEMMPFTLPTLNRQQLFVRAEDWTGVDSNSDGIPDWWAWKYFGDFNQAATNDYDGDGVNNGDEYANGSDPNEINFTVRLGNQNFNTTNAAGSFLVLGGVPSYSTVLVNREDFTNAVWSIYDGTAHLNLGSTDGVYQVWLGLKGRTEDSQPTWIGTAVTLTRTLPQLFIASPTNNVVGQPYLQLQGHSSLPLASVRYDVSNAVAFVTNQLGSITGHTLDTNLLAYTADYFQGYDIQLTNGLNLITVHATDPAGNVTTTNFAVTLDYAAATNPVIQLTWPQNGLQLCGSSFTLRGWTEDASAKISAQITDASGNTNTLVGLVERTGVVWVENLPLSSGTNFVTLRVTNAAGLSSATNITVVKNSMTLALTSIAGNLWLPTVSVSGSISEPTYCVWVNGVQGTNNGDGTWSADNVPVSPSGVASFDMRASSSDGDPDASTNVAKDSEVILESAIWESYSLANVDTGFGGAWETIHDKGNYTYTDGGSFTHHLEAHDTNAVMVYSATTVATLAPNLTITKEHSENSQGVNTNRYNMNSFTIARELGSLSFVGNLGQVKSMGKTSQVKLMLHTGGQATIGGEALVEVGVGDGTEELVKAPFGVGIEVTNLTVEGLGENLGPDGLAYGKAAVGSAVSIILNAKVPFHHFNNVAGAPRLKSWTIYPALTNPNRERTTIGVGEEVDLGGMPSRTKWSAGGGGLSGTNGSDVRFTAPSNAPPGGITVTVIATVKNASLAIPFNVVPPSGIDHAKIIGTNRFSLTIAGAGMTNVVWIAPTSVSFYRVWMEEVGAVSTNATGYFTNTNVWPANNLNHGKHGANNWFQLTSQNQWSDAASSGTCIPPWSTGNFTWPIPAAWQVGGSNSLRTNYITGWDQNFTIDASGTVTVQKFGNSITRTTNNLITTTP